MFRALGVAVQFLTCLPVRFNVQPDEKTVGYSLVFYPFVGLLVGALLVLSAWGLQNAPTLVATAILVVVWIICTGGLHLDGLADSADAWMGGLGDSEKTLAIMKDPACGASGVTALLATVLLKFAAVHSLFIAQQWMPLLCATVLARALIPLLFLTTPYVRNQGLGVVLANNFPRKLTVLSVLLTVLCVVTVLPADYLWLVLTALSCCLLLRHMMMQRIRGMTGDTVGATVEIAETGILLAAVLFVI